MKRLKISVCWLFVIFVLPAAFAGAVEVGSKAPGFRLPSAQNSEVALSDYEGQLVLLKIGTTWCPGCQMLGDEIDKLVTVLDERNVAVIDVFMQDTLPMIKEALEDKAPYSRYHALIDDGSVHEAYNVYLIPRLLIVDESQLVRYDSVGQELSADEIEAMIEKFAVAEVTDEKG